MDATGQQITLVRLDQRHREAFVRYEQVPEDGRVCRLRKRFATP
jgi:hypothetical protein